MKGKDFLVRFSGYVVVFLLSAIFILASVVTISKSGRTVAEIIAEGALGLMFGLAIDSLLGMQGINNGKRSKEFLETKRLHGEAVDAISPRIHELDDWCEKKNREVLMLQRTKILAAEGLRYKDCFDADGQGLGYASDYTPKSKDELRALDREGRTQEKDKRRRERARERAYYKALRLKLTPLSAASLTGDSARPDDPHYFGENERGYERRSIINDFFSKGCTAGIFGYYCVEQLINFSPAALIWRCLQVGIYLAGGIFKMISAQAFITGDYRGQIVRKIDYLQMFKNSKTEVKENGGHISGEGF